MTNMSRAHECVYKVVLVGSYSVGKTSLFWRLKTGQFMEHQEAGDAASSLSVTDRCTVSYVMRTGTVVQVTTVAVLRYSCIILYAVYASRRSIDLFTSCG